MLQRRYKQNKWFEDFVRRMYAISPLFVVAYNTIASIYALGRGTVTKTLKSTELPLRETMGLYAFAFADENAFGNYYYVPSSSGSVPFPKATKFWQHQCPSIPSSMTMTCTYANGPIFLTIVYVWVSYFVIFFIYRMAVLWNYNPDDLRFYIATQRLNGLNGNQVFRLLLFILSVATFLLVIYFSFLQQAATSAYVQAAIFVVVNFLAGSNLSSIEYKMHVEHRCLFGLLKTRKLKSMSLFASPCLITLPDEERAWFGGVFLPQAKIFNIIELAITKAGVGDTSALKALGDADLIKQYMEELTREEKIADVKEPEDDGKAGKSRCCGSKKVVEAEASPKEIKQPSALTEASKRIGALLPLTLLLLGIFNLIFGGLQNNQVYSPPAPFLNQRMGFYSTDGSFVTTQSMAGDAFYSVPGDIRKTEADYCFGAFGDTASGFATHIGAQLTCALEMSYWMFALGAMCLVFFVVWFWFRLTITLGFSAHDLRFLIATDRANSLYRNSILCAVGGSLAAVALLSIWYYRARVGNPPENYFLDLVNVSAVVFSLVSFSHSRYHFGVTNTLRSGQTSLEMSEFPDECLITLKKAKLTNLYGGLVTHASIFNDIEEAIRLAARGDASKLEAFGDAELIKQYMAKLLSHDAKTTNTVTSEDKYVPDAPIRDKPAPLSVDAKASINSVAPISSSMTDDVETPTSLSQ